MVPKLPPAIIFLIHLGLAWLIYRYLTFAAFSIPGQDVLILVLTIAGIGICLLSMFTMFRARTTIDPVFPDRASSLVTGGIFSISRNPIYLALLLMLMAWVIWLGNWISFVLLVTFIWHLSYFQIKTEEQALEEKFGEQYRQYRMKVRRWL